MGSATDHRHDNGRCPFARTSCSKTILVHLSVILETRGDLLPWDEVTIDLIGGLAVGVAQPELDILEASTFDLDDSIGD